MTSRKRKNRHRKIKLLNKMTSLLNDLNPVLTMLVPVLAAIITVVARNPIHAILWLIATFLVTCGLIFYHFSLGFTCSLVIIVYIGAIAILFRFIIMMVPIKERQPNKGSAVRWLIQTVTLISVYLAGCWMFFSHLVSAEASKLGNYWTSFGNQIDQQSLLGMLPNKMVEGITVSDLYQSDLALYGARLYQESAYPILLTGLVLLFVLVAAIVLCRDE